MSEPMPGRVVSSGWLDLPPETVYDYVTTLKHWPEWYPGVLDVHGQTEFPASIGDAVTESVRSFGMLRKLQWTVVESSRPSRFVSECRWHNLRLIRPLRLTYSFESSTDGARTRMERWLDYELAGVARVLDPIFVRRHLKRDAAVALATLQELIRHGAEQGRLKHAG